MLGDLHNCAKRVPQRSIEPFHRNPRHSLPPSTHDFDIGHFSTDKHAASRLPSTAYTTLITSFVFGQKVSYSCTQNYVCCSTQSGACDITQPPTPAIPKHTTITTPGKTPQHKMFFQVKYLVHLFLVPS